MPEIFKIQTSLDLSGNLAAETLKLLRRMEQIETRAKAIPRELVALERPLETANRLAERLARTMSQIRKGSGTQRSSSNDVVRWAAASARELGDMRAQTKGIGTAARGIGRSFEGWEGKINRATRALERMESVATRMRFPEMPSAPRGGYGSGGGRSSGPGASGSHGGSQRGRGRGGHGGYGHTGSHEGSAIAGLVGIGGGVHTMEATVEPGMEMVQIARNMKQTGASDAQIQQATEVARAGSKAFPNLSTLEIFEHINDLRGILGDMDKAIHEAPDILPEFSALKAKAGSKGSASAIHEVYAAVKSAETANQIAGEDVRKHANSLARLSFWYGDKLNPSKYFAAQSGAGQMLNLTSDRFRYGAFAALTQESPTAGTSFGTFASKGIAGLRMMVSGLDKAAEYGLLDTKTIQRSKAGRVKPGAQFSDVGLDGKTYDRAKDPDLWLYKNVLPKLKAGGVNIDDKAELLRVLGQIFTDKKAFGFLFSLAQQRSKIEKDYKGFEGTSGDFRDYLNKSPNAATQSVQAQGNSFATALSGPAIPDIVEKLGRFSAGLATATGYLEKHPLLAQSLTGAGLGVVGGLATAGTVGLTVMAVSMLTLPALAIGAGAAVTIASLMIPWDKIYETMGWKPGIGMGGKDVGGKQSNAEDGLAGVGPSITQAEAERDRKRAAAIQGLGNSYQNVIDAQKRFADATGHTGSMADQARPLVDRLSDAFLGLAKRLILTEGIVERMSFNGGGGGLGGLIQRASFGGDGAIGTFNGKALPVDGGLGIGHTASKAERAAYIRQAALRNGIDPEVALRVAQSEGFNKYVGDYGTSFGDWQLHFGGSGIRGMNSGGLGDVLRRRGINAKDPLTWRQQTDFAMKWAREHGWGDWHGARRAGIGNRQGIGAVRPQQPARPPVQPYQRSRELQANLHVDLDGRRIAMNTSRHQFDGANGPATGASFADASELYPQV